MKLGKISPPKGAIRRKKRLGCGIGSGKGKTSGKGHKGQRARSGSKIRAWFEGGQMPLQQRLPKVGFNSPFKVVYETVNLEEISRLEIVDVTPETLKEAGLIRSLKRPVKLLGRGDISKALRVKIHAFSASVSEKIIRAGGSIEVISEEKSDKK